VAGQGLAGEARALLDGLARSSNAGAEMQVVTILGAGAMGSALATPLRERGHEVRLWGTWLDDDLLDAVGRHLPGTQGSGTVARPISQPRANVD